MLADLCIEAKVLVFFSRLTSPILLCFLTHGRDTSICFHVFNLFRVIWFCGPIDLWRQKHYFPSQRGKNYYPSTQSYVSEERSPYFIYFLLFLAFFEVHWRSYVICWMKMIIIVILGVKEIWATILIKHFQSAIVAFAFGNIKYNLAFHFLDKTHRYSMHQLSFAPI